MSDDNNKWNPKNPVKLKMVCQNPDKCEGVEADLWCLLGDNKNICEHLLIGAKVSAKPKNLENKRFMKKWKLKELIEDLFSDDDLLCCEYESGTILVNQVIGSPTEYAKNRFLLRRDDE